MTPIPRPGPGRITLVLLAVLPAVLAYPWPTTRDRWLLGLAVAALIVLLGWWRGLHVTTIVRRRLTMSRHRNGIHAGLNRGDPDLRSTALLRVTGAPGDDLLPLTLIAGYLNRYGLAAHHIRITSHDDRSGVPGRDTWIGLTFSAAENLPALQARSSRIPLRETVEVAARRLADQLRELGWQTAVVGDADIRLFAPTARESWTGVTDDDGHIAAFQIGVDNRLPDTLAAVWAGNATQVWSVLEIAGSAERCTIAAGCALRHTGDGGGTEPLPRLTAQRGNHRSALQVLHPLSGSDLAGHIEVSAAGLATIRWPVVPVAVSA